MAMGQESVEYPVSRKIGFAALLKTAPAWSFGSKHERTNKDPGPGPGTYGASMEFGSKGIGFGSSTRYRKQDDLTPSAQDYDTNGSIRSTHRKSASFSFGTSKPRPSHRTSTPGPGAYEAGQSKDTVRPARTSCTIAERLDPPKDSTKRPAPNEYNPDYSVKEHPGVSIKLRHEPYVPHDTGPGPLDYDVLRKGLRSAPGKSFGVSRPQGRPGNGVPAPGAYGSPDVHQVKPQTPSKTIPRSRRDAWQDSGVPGPGTYLHGEVVRHIAGHSVSSNARSPAAYTFGGKPYFSRGAATPGPGAYDPKDTGARAAPAASFHGTSPLDSRRKYPGPGHYRSEEVFKTLHNSPPAYTISARYDPPKDSDRKPAPNAYNPEYEVKERPGVSLKFRHEPSSPPGANTPGPLDYADKDLRSIYLCSCKSKGKSFGLRLKQHSRESVPGPQYKVGCSTLGIAASQKVMPSQLDRVVVL